MRLTEKKEDMELECEGAETLISAVDELTTLRESIDTPVLNLGNKFVILTHSISILR